jgi:uncharacterized protein involved in response to NO
VAKLQLLEQREARQAQTAASFALWQLGFRPFYLLASVFSALSIALWALQYAGWLGAPYLTGSVWHAHEMLFGYTMAVVTGFLFTAVRNWTNRPTPTGIGLMAIAALWIAGRILVVTPHSWAAVIANAAFPLAVAVGIGIPLVRSGNRRNYFFVGVMIVMSIAVLGVHLAPMRLVALPDWLGIQIALDMILFVMAVMGGRVIPIFTNNGVPGTNARRQPFLEKLALGSVLVLLVADALQLEGLLLVSVLATAALAHAARLALWQPWKTLRVPLVWVLHAAYLWLPIHLALRCLAELDLIIPPIATHALTIGAIGGLTLGMMTRTARGHTGRPLEADGFEVSCYMLILGAAVVRVFVPLAAPAAYLVTVQASAFLWSAAFALYAIRYWPVLTRPRLDGKPG